MDALTPNLPSLEALLQSLIQERIIFFPVRHHSPACAWHLQQLIQAEKPAAVLIEGPADATSLIPFILHEKTQTPFALYTTYIDRDRRLVQSPEESPNTEPLRFAGYYPFCDYSPELVALRAGASVAAALQFIDLTYSEQVIALHKASDPEAALRLRSLQEEHHLKRSAYLQALAHRTGCRDADDLWDHLFEAHCQDVETSTFIRQVATYCYMARLDAAPEALEADGTHAREAAMAGAIAATLQETPGKVLVVTGGFHTVVLPDLIQASPTAPKPLKLQSEAAQTVLMRYSFEQLDALNGYAAGMPAPEYYQRLWMRLHQPICTDARPCAPTLGESDTTESPHHALTQTACELLIDIRSLTYNQKTLPPLSVADEIAAFEQAQRLAHFRGHPGPTREDLLDAVRSCFVKGAMDAEGALLMTVVQLALRGDRIGNLPPEVGVPPIVEDFRRTAQRLRIKLDSSLPKSLTLDLYRKANHRQASRFLHCLKFLTVPFASLKGGPDFVRGVGLDRIQEHWEYRWTPQTESTLIEQSLYGTTVEAATLHHLQQAIAGLADVGEARSAIAVVELLTQACRMGLHAHTAGILTLIDEHVAADPSFVSLVQAVGQLSLLWQSREPLEAHTLTPVPQLIAIAYRRLCYLVPHQADCPLEESNPVLNAFSAVWELLNSDRASVLDAELFVSGLLTLLDQAQGNPVILGGAVGILYNAGRVEQPELIGLAAGYLDSAVVDAAKGIGFIRGLLRTCREIAWSLPDLLREINARLENWPEDEFLRVLPELRLAFADLIPRETDKVAAIVAQFHGQKELGNLLHRNRSEMDLQLGLKINQLVEASLAQDNLEHWISN